MQRGTGQFFKDKNGKVVLWQPPNFLLLAWIVFTVVALLMRNGSHTKVGFERLSTAVLFAWAYSEITKGVNNFRKTLGITVLAVIIYGFFR